MWKAVIVLAVILGIWLLVVLAPVVFVFYGKILNRMGRRTCVRDIRQFIRFALHRGMDESRLRLRRPWSRYRVDFEKHVPREGETRFEMILEGQRCSASEFQTAHESLKAHGIPVQVCSLDAENKRRLLVECGPDLHRATTAATVVFTEAFGLGIQDTIRACHKGWFDMDMTRDPMVGWEPEQQEKPAATDHPPGAENKGAPGEDNHP